MKEEISVPCWIKILFRSSFHRDQCRATETAFKISKH